ncbi:hypothetical protein MPTK1_5g08560 [Marchantia polymorpha subsp. ruderalis]|uniref:Uncharacterized protein n=2 Tax=Marchantia polymorpha TaxID=3197 RepID=A0AAF6BGA9_MARPO|nr:hypothetical protein MARPO_0086s0061 [Marchantia polymorpha]BBN11043.1 hypothetical protein Mp_5g08560 [Marchantia polymorpha subsp. ruderalis]|eukprot:PTQ33742.1 hypothetical protein MARPO_0086s0061 [Marchantia polymorpha]
MGLALLHVALSRVSNLLSSFALVSSPRKSASPLGDHYQATQLTKLESLGSQDSAAMVMDELDDPERCLLPHTQLRHASHPQQQQQQQQTVHRERTEFSKCLGGTFCFKATKASVIAPRKDPFKILHGGGRADESSRCRRRGLRRRLSTCIRIDKDLELSGVRVRQVLYYA